MAKQLFANNATSMLSGILTQGGNVLVCSNGEGNRFPSPAADEYFLLTIYTKDAYANEQKVEVVKVTSRAGDTLMIERDVELLTGQSGGYAYNGNTEQAYLELRWTAGGAGNVLQASDNLAGLSNASVARTNLGLGSVDNTTDLNKPISTATQAALNGKADTGHTHAGFVSSTDPRLSDARPASDVSAWAKAATKPSYTKTEVGLGNVDNTSDANKPVSTATQTALNAKQATLVSGTNIKTINGLSAIGSGNIDVGGAVIGILKCNGGGTYSAATSGTDIKTINGASLLGSGNLEVISALPVVVVSTTTQAMQANKHYVVTTAGAAAALTMPASPTVGDRVQISVTNGRTDNSVVVNVSPIQGQANDLFLDAGIPTYEFKYLDSTRGWYL